MDQRERLQRPSKTTLPMLSFDATAMQNLRDGHDTPES
jgi:hypothetical protein